MINKGVDYQKKVDLIRNNTFENEIIIVDGQGRSGKNLIAVLLSTMPRVEKMRLDSQVDYISRYFALGKLSSDAAAVALKIEFDEKYYYNEISRDVNFRWSDYSGVFKQGKRLTYFIRLFQNADEKAILRLKKKNPIFQEMTHDALHLADFYFDTLGARLKLIHVLRDPVANIYEQNRRNFGSRIGTDPRELQLTFNYKGESIPIMALGNEEEYLTANPLERLVLMVDSMFSANMTGYFNLDKIQKSRVSFINFDQFVLNPYPYLSELENFIGSQFGRATKRILNRENCPRESSSGERDERIKQISANLSSPYKDRFTKLINLYDSAPWLDS